MQIPPQILVQVRVCTPQVLVQAPYTVVGEHGVGAGVGAGVAHDCPLQPLCEVGPVGHATPPLAAFVEIANVRVCVPPPHVTEQLLQLFQFEIQLTGHDCPLQPLCDVGPVGHATPPEAAFVEIANVRVWVPPPHVTEQLLQLFQFEIQSTGLWVQIGIAFDHSEFVPHVAADAPVMK